MIPPWLARFRAQVTKAVPTSAVRWSNPTARPAAVLILFGDGADGPDLLLIERAATLNKHAGQPAFPGGAIDSGDAGPVGAALREAEEETGLDAAGVDILAVLPELYLPRSDYLVTPVIAWWREPTEVFARDPDEVAAVVRVPIAELSEPANRLNVRSPSGLVGPAFRVRGMLVWGFTAALLAHLLDVGGWALPWDTGRIEDLPPDLFDLATRG